MEDDVCGVDANVDDASEDAACVLDDCCDERVDGAAGG